MCPIKYLVKPGFQKRASMVLGWLKRRLTAAAHRNGLLSNIFLCKYFYFLSGGKQKWANRRFETGDCYRGTGEYLMPRGIDLSFIVQP